MSSRSGHPPGAAHGRVALARPGTLSRHHRRRRRWAAAVRERRCRRPTGGRWRKAGGSRGSAELGFFLDVVAQAVDLPWPRNPAAAGKSPSATGSLESPGGNPEDWKPPPSLAPECSERVRAEASPPVSSEEASYPHLEKFWSLLKCQPGGWKQQAAEARRYYGGASGTASASQTDDGYLTKLGAKRICVICLGEEHKARTCPELRCFTCFGTGHNMKQCPKAQIKCSRCGRKGHNQDECAWQALVEGARWQKQREVRCVSCGEYGHPMCRMRPQNQSMASRSTEAPEEWLNSLVPGNDSTSSSSSRGVADSTTMAPEEAAEAKRQRKAAKKAAKEAAEAPAEEVVDEEEAKRKRKAAKKAAKLAAAEAAAEPEEADPPKKAKKEKKREAEDEEEVEAPLQKKIKTLQETIIAGAAAPKSLKAFIKGLPYTVDEAQLRKDFEGCGEISQMQFPKNEEGNPKGFAFITFATQEGFDAALKFDNTEYSGRYIGVQMAEGSGGKSKDAKGKGKGDKGKAGDWICPNAECGDTVFASRAACRQCGTARPGGVPAGGGTTVGDNEHTVFLRGLPWAVTVESLRKDFDACGEIERLNMPMNEEGRPKGIAFIKFMAPEGVEAALKFDETDYGGRTINVTKAEDRGKGKDGKGKGKDGKGKDKDGKGKGKKGKDKTPTQSFAKNTGCILASTGEKKTFDDSDDE